MLWPELRPEGRRIEPLAIDLEWLLCFDVLLVADLATGFAFIAVLAGIFAELAFFTATFLDGVLAIFLAGDIAFLTDFTTGRLIFLDADFAVFAGVTRALLTTDFLALAEIGLDTVFLLLLLTGLLLTVDALFLTEWALTLALTGVRADLATTFAVVLDLAATFVRVLLTGRAVFFVAAVLAFVLTAFFGAGWLVRTDAAIFFGADFLLLVLLLVLLALFAGLAVGAAFLTDFFTEDIVFFVGKAEAPISLIARAGFMLSIILLSNIPFAPFSQVVSGFIFPIFAKAASKALREPKARSRVSSNVLYK